MGDGALLLCRQLAEGPALLRHQEHRVVAKSRRPHGGKGDGTVAPALRRQLVPAGKGAGEAVGAENSADGGGTASESERTKNER